MQRHPRIARSAGLVKPFFFGFCWLSLISRESRQKIKIWFIETYKSPTKLCTIKHGSSGENYRRGSSPFLYSRMFAVPYFFFSSLGTLV